MLGNNCLNYSADELINVTSTIEGNRTILVTPIVETPYISSM